MRKLFFWCFFLLFCGAALAQAEGTVRAGNERVQEATIYNLRTKTFTVSDANGNYKIDAQPNDTLLISHMAFGSKKILVDKNLVLPDVMFTSSRTTLDEVYLDQTNHAARLGLPNAEKEVMTKSQRKLNAAGDVPTWALVGALVGAVPLETVINKITGKTKKLKKEVALERQMQQADYIGNKYYNLMVNRWKMNEDEVQQFIFFVSLDDDFTRQVKHPESQAFQFYLTEQYLQFKEINND